MDFEPRNGEEQAQAITRLVDSSLRPDERQAVEAWANQRPEIAQQVAAQRVVSNALGSGEPAVPEALVAAVRDRVHPLTATETQRSLRDRLGGAPRWRPALGLGLAAAACAAVVVLIVGITGATAGPSIPAAAQLAFAPSTAGAPAAKNGRYLDVSYAGITYPNYAAEFAAVPTGIRTDRIGGRPALTVFYRLHNGARLSYTVFSGRPVPLPRAARTVVFDGVPLRTFHTSSGLAVVTLVRFGRTCILAAPTPRDLVLALAAAPVREQA